MTGNFVTLVLQVPSFPLKESLFLVSEEYISKDCLFKCHKETNNPSMYVNGKTRPYTTVTFTNVKLNVKQRSEV